MCKEWQIDVKGYGLVRISTTLLKRIYKYKQLESTSPESGGVLIGKHLNSEGTLLIDDMTEPQESDKQGRCQFYRSAEHSSIVNKVWLESNKHSTYVGLWHSHPEPIPHYSCVDKYDWENALRHSKYEGNHLFFIILGQTHVRIWMGIKSTFRTQILLIGEYKIGN